MPYAPAPWQLSHELEWLLPKGIALRLVLRHSVTARSTLWGHRVLETAAELGDKMLLSFALAPVADVVGQRNSVGIENHVVVPKTRYGHMEQVWSDPVIHSRSQDPEVHQAHHTRCP